MEKSRDEILEELILNYFEKINFLPQCSKGYIYIKEMVLLSLEKEIKVNKLADFSEPIAQRYGLTKPQVVLCAARALKKWSKTETIYNFLVKTKMETMFMYNQNMQKGEDNYELSQNKNEKN